MDPKEIMEKVGEWFFLNDEFANKMEAFASAHCDCFSADTTSDGEQKLQYTEIYNQFRALFESELEAFVKSQLNMSVEDFYKVAMDDFTKNGEEDSPLKWIVATSDYEVFLQMMAEQKRKKQESS